MDKFLDQIVSYMPPAVHEFMERYDVDNATLLVLVFFGIFAILGLYFIIRGLLPKKQPRGPHFSVPVYERELKRLSSMYEDMYENLSSGEDDDEEEQTPEQAKLAAQIEYLDSLIDDIDESHDDELENRYEYIGILRGFTIPKKLRKEAEAALERVNITKAEACMHTITPLLTDPEQKAYGDYLLGFMAMSRADFETAAAHYEKALKVEPENELFLKRAGFCAQSAEQYKVAEGYYRRRLAAAEKAEEKDRQSCADALFDIGVVFSEAEDFATAEGYLRQAVEEGRIAWGKNSSDLANYLGSLTWALFNLEKYAEAEVTFREARAISSKGRPNNHPDNIRSLQNLAGILRRQGKDEEVAKIEKQIEKYSR